MNTLFDFFKEKTENEKLPEWDFKKLPFVDFISEKEKPKKEVYEIDEPLRDAVRLAISYGKPLLVTGDPGTGKTRLAYFVAQHFGMTKPLVFNAKTTSLARDMLYIYDQIKHFRDIQDKDKNADEMKEGREMIGKYIYLQPLGKAIYESDKIRQIVLIDEIDKAPRDFPNDLLDVMERMEFEIPEANLTDANKIQGNQKNRPVVIITSNSEKSLPEAFLRRCVYFNIELPDDKTLRKILKAKLLKNMFSDDLLNRLIGHFRYIRSITGYKRPATDELIQWVFAVKHKQISDETIKALKTDDKDTTESKTKIEKSEMEKLRAIYPLLAKTSEDLKNIELNMKSL